MVNKNWNPEVGRPKKAESEESSSSNSRNISFCSAALIIHAVHTMSTTDTEREADIAKQQLFGDLTPIYNYISLHQEAPMYEKIVKI